MELFIRSDQFNFIKSQTQNLVNAHSSVNDIDVLNALKSLAKDKIYKLFSDLTDEQKQLLIPIQDIDNKGKAEEFLLQLAPYVLPFKNVTEQTIKKLFPKVKKLKLPNINQLDFKETSYIGWNDIGSNKKYMIVIHQNKLVGLQGTFKNISKKGICTLCNRHEEIGLFLSETKGSVRDTFIKRGNLICQDSQKCNQNLITLDKLNDFILLLQG